MSKFDVFFAGAIVSLALINQDGNSATYRARLEDGQLKVVVRHTDLKRKGPRGTAMERHVIEVTHEVYPTPTELGGLNKMWSAIEVEASTPDAQFNNLCLVFARMFSRDQVLGQLRLGGVGEYIGAV